MIMLISLFFWGGKDFFFFNFFVFGENGAIELFDARKVYVWFKFCLFFI